MTKTVYWLSTIILARFSIGEGVWVVDMMGQEGPRRFCSQAFRH